MINVAKEVEFFAHSWCTTEDGYCVRVKAYLKAAVKLVQGQGDEEEVVQEIVAVVERVMEHGQQSV